MCFRLYWQAVAFVGDMCMARPDAIGGEPKDGLVRPPDLLATLYHCLGYSPTTELHDSLGRPFPISRGEPVKQILV